MGMQKPLKVMIGPTSWELRPFQSYVVEQHCPQPQSSSVYGHMGIKLIGTMSWVKWEYIWIGSDDPIAGTDINMFTVTIPNL